MGDCYARFGGANTMRTTCERHATYLGVDLTDGHAARKRPVDVCGLDVADGALRARFWQWTYEGGTSDITALEPEIRAARGTVLDGPQALAAVGATMRVSERRLAAAGKTPSVAPTRGPYAGFIRTSVEIFAAFAHAGLDVSPDALPGAVAEHYPGGNWPRLVRGLPSKKLAAGVAARRAILEALGVELGAQPLTDDHLDACLGAVIAAAADDALPGARVERIGSSLVRDGAVLREGPILVMVVEGECLRRIEERVRSVPS